MRSMLLSMVIFLSVPVLAKPPEGDDEDKAILTNPALEERIRTQEADGYACLRPTDAAVRWMCTNGPNCAFFVDVFCRRTKRGALPDGKSEYVRVLVSGTRTSGKPPVLSISDAEVRGMEMVPQGSLDECRKRLGECERALPETGLVNPARQKSLPEMDPQGKGTDPKWGVRGRGR